MGQAVVQVTPAPAVTGPSCQHMAVRPRDLYRCVEHNPPAGIRKQVRTPALMQIEYLSNQMGGIKEADNDAHAKCVARA